MTLLEQVQSEYDAWEAELKAFLAGAAPLDSTIYLVRMAIGAAKTEALVAALKADNADAVRLLKDLQWNHAQDVHGDVETDHDVYVYLAEHGAFEPKPFLLDYADGEE